MKNASVKFVVPQIWENSPGQVLGEVTLSDSDDDSLGHGSPFTIRLDSNSPEHITRGFNLTFNKGETMFIFLYNKIYIFIFSNFLFVFDSIIIVQCVDPCIVRYLFKSFVLLATRVATARCTYLNKIF